jgi:benzoate membrane transport protein
VQPIGAGVSGAIIGFASAFAIVLFGLRSAGATEQEATSGLFVLCLAQAFLAILLSALYRMPLSFAWSTPGAALLVASHAGTGDFAAAVGAFIVCGALVMLTGAIPALSALVIRIPATISGALLAGVLLPICLAPILAVGSMPMLVLPIIAVWLIMLRVKPSLAVPSAVLTTVIIVVVTSSPGDFSIGLPRLDFIVPAFEPLVLLSLGVPLYLVTMAGQNVPGISVLSLLGYRDVPVRAVLIGTGAMTVASSFFGGHAVNLSAITAAMVAGPDAHPDPGRRWIAAVSGGVTYIALGVSASAATALVSAAPDGVIAAVAGLALVGTFGTAMTTALTESQYRLTAAVTFLTVVSSISTAGVGSAFWGLLAGFAVLAGVDHPIALRARRASEAQNLAATSNSVALMVEPTMPRPKPDHNDIA